MTKQDDQECCELPRSFNDLAKELLQKIQFEKVGVGPSRRYYYKSIEDSLNYLLDYRGL